MIMNRTAFLLLLSAFLAAGPIYSQVISTDGAASHGTVNIFLGNRNGLVAVTDSRISSGGRPVGYGQKLFKLDDHTICSIAGFFSDSGPTFSGPLAHPLETDIASIFNAYIAYVWKRRSGSLADKFHSLANSWAFDLNLLEEVDRIAKRPADSAPSILTIAGYDRGRLWVGQIRLIPTMINGRFEYRMPPETPPLEQVTGKNLIIKTAGIDQLARKLLDDPMSQANYDPIFGIYAESEENGGSPLSLSQLRTLANRLERMTAIEYPSVVGGFPQVAVMSGGKATLFPPILPFKEHLPGRRAVSVFINQTMFNITIKNNRPGTLMLFEHDLIHDCSVDLDGMIFADSTFYNCVFNYDGSPLVLFDGTNKISYSNLALSGHVSDDSKIVTMFTSEYPDTRIVRNHGRRPPK